jgi:peptidoglycan/LPS O-acetylase OafA/YrhL
VVGVVAVAVWRNVLVAHGASATRTYFALDTRADSLLVGCAIAAWLRAARRGAASADGSDGTDGGAAAWVWQRRLDRVAAVLPVAGPAAIVGLAVAMMTAPDGWGPHPTSLSYGGYTIIALLAGVVVLAVEQGAATSRLFRALAVRPLAWLGRISYGFYLWHFPVVVYWGYSLTEAFGRWGATAAVAVISIGLAATSYYLLERPIQRHRPRWVDAPAAARTAAPPATARFALVAGATGGHRGPAAPTGKTIPELEPAQSRA